MPRLHRCLLLACLLVAAVVSLGACANLRSLVVVGPNDNGRTKATLTVRTSRVSIPLNFDDNTNIFFEYTGRFYELEDEGPLLPGPTLKAKPGGKIVLTVINDLGNESAPNASMVMNSFHHPNVTNVHFHGMHSDPKKDNPFEVYGPNESHVYKIAIPRDHEPGHHWYHAHAHGALYFQVMGGLFGSIDVGEGDFMTTPVHPFRGWDSELLMVHLYRLGTSDKCDGMTMSAMDTAMGNLLPSNPQFVDRKGKSHPMPPDLFLVNGQHRPTVTVRRGHPMLLRVAYAGGSCYLNLSLPRQCDFHMTAVDGVQMKRTRAVTERWVYFTPATRRSLAVECTEEGVFPVHHAGDPSDVLFYIKSRTPKMGDTLKVDFPVTLPKYHPDYLYLNGQQRFYREISFSQKDLPSPKPYYVIGQGTDCASLQNSSTCYYEPFHGEIGKDMAGYRGFAVPQNTVITARIFGDPTDPRPHPLHFHVNHFQYLSFEPRPGGQHENETMEMYGVISGEFRDTIPILDGVTIIRWQAATYTGEVVYHCHALHHEDRGMMAAYYVYSPLNASGADGKFDKKMRWLHKPHVLLLLFVFLLASAAALAWREMRRRGLRSVADVRRAYDDRPDAGSSSERIPLIPRTA